MPKQKNEEKQAPKPKAKAKGNKGAKPAAAPGAKGAKAPVTITSMIDQAEAYEKQAVAARAEADEALAAMLASSEMTDQQVKDMQEMGVDQRARYIKVMQHGRAAGHQPPLSKAYMAKLAEKLPVLEIPDKQADPMKNISSMMQEVAAISSNDDGEKNDTAQKDGEKGRGSIKDLSMMPYVEGSGGPTTMETMQWLREAGVWHHAYRERFSATLLLPVLLKALPSQVKTVVFAMLPEDTDLTPTAVLDVVKEEYCRDFELQSVEDIQKYRECTRDKDSLVSFLKRYKVLRQKAMTAGLTVQQTDGYDLLRAADLLPSQEANILQQISNMAKTAGTKSERPGYHDVLRLLTALSKAFELQADRKAPKARGRGGGGAALVGGVDPLSDEAVMVGGSGGKPNRNVKKKIKKAVKKALVAERTGVGGGGGGGNTQYKGGKGGGGKGGGAGRQNSPGKGGGKGKGGKGSRRPGDWDCPNCRNVNFAFRKVCNSCGQNKPKGNPGGAGGGAVKREDGADPRAKIPCRFFKAGTCDKGAACSFSHA